MEIGREGKKLFAVREMKGNKTHPMAGHHPRWCHQLLTHGFSILINKIDGRR